ncbi:hypothetical protein BDV95DRAFT_580791 [Massariosphaeria phaeospora]|uniref:Uncharacterized protein n=1 Tax=Massariosphaeria phaeospora TaxID=100035 RepID=A0A7C8M291_9PLEO|nr:hypothetical protein BDV95DRAFT_580791 [Massariosphaeria phaeospora]
MINTRVAYISLRLMQFSTAATVLGLVAFFLQQHSQNGDYPLARLIYSIVMAANNRIPSRTFYLFCFVFLSSYLGIHAGLSHQCLTELRDGFGFVHSQHDSPS